MTRTAHSRQKPRFTSHDFAYVIFLCAWTILSLLLSQLTVGAIFTLVVGHSFSQPFWMSVYYVLTYALALALVLLVPPKMFDLYQRFLAKRRLAPQMNSEEKSQIQSSSHVKNRAAKIQPSPEKSLKVEKTLKNSDRSFENSANPFRITSTELGFAHWPTFTDLGLAPIGYFVYLVLAGLLTNFMRLFPWFNLDQAQDTGFGYFLTSFDRFVAMLALIIIAPLAEEIIMRGWLYGKIRTRLSFVPAATIVSLIFGLLHGQWNVAVGVFAMSLVLCSLREITGTIWASIFLHALSNAIAFYFLYVARF